jgi:alpha-ketoglutarate-dependent taurine dioxygenase
MRLHPTGKFDNRPLPARFIRVEPLAAAMGAEIKGVSIGDLSDEAFAEVEAALFRHKMIFFRGQKLSHAEHERFSLRFGPFAEDAYTKGVAGHDSVQPVIKEADDLSLMIFGSGWHTDSPFLPRPPAITILRSIEVPEFGGDTIWANSALAYAMLSDSYREMISDLQVRFSMRDVLRSAQETAEPRDTPIGRLGATRDSKALPEHICRKVEGSVHPMVRTHPATGEKALYLDGTYAVGIEGMTDEEARSILDFLLHFTVQHEFTCRLRWEPDTLVVWDNRSCVHQAFNDYQGHRRELYRTTVAGETPS